MLADMQCFSFYTYCQIIQFLGSGADQDFFLKPFSSPTKPNVSIAHVNTQPVDLVFALSIRMHPLLLALLCKLPGDTRQVTMLPTFEEVRVGFSSRAVNILPEDDYLVFTRIQK